MRYAPSSKNDAFANVYSQDRSPPSFDPQNSSLGEISDRFMSIITQDNDHNAYSMRPSAAPFDQKMMLSRDGRRNDYRNIDYRALLSDHHPAPRLNYAKSEQTLRDAGHTEHVRLQRKYDFDGFIAHITGLEALRRGLSLSWNPSYLDNNPGNIKVPLNGIPPESCKSLRLGTGPDDRGWNYNVWVLFPKMTLPRGRPTALTKNQTRLWIDDILLPALQEILPQEVLNRHPLSYEHSITKSHTRQQTQPGGSGQPGELRYDIPAQFLGPIWRKVQEYAGYHADYQNPTLVLTGWNQKVHFQDLSFVTSRAAFLNHLEQRFDTSLDLMPEAYVDLAVENTPIGPEAGNLTLLWKKSCLDAWASHFRHPHRGPHHTTTTQYPFSLTRDASSCNVKLHPANHLRRIGGIIFNKAYHLRHHLLANPWHISPFQNPHFEALPLSAQEWERWYTANLAGDAGFSGNPGSAADVGQFYQRKYRQHVQAYISTKVAVATAIHASTQAKSTEGLRKEYRMTLNAVRMMPPDDAPSDVDLWDPQHRPLDEDTLSEDADDSADDPLTDLGSDAYSSQSSDDSDTSQPIENRIRHPVVETHRPYWILPTSEVNRFVLAVQNRYLFLFEVLVARLHPGPGTLIPASPEEQRQNAVMGSALLRSVQLASGGQPGSAMRELWLRTYTDSRPAPSQSAVAFQSGSRPPPRQPLISFSGLDYRACIQVNGIASLPDDMIVWSSIPHFHPSILPRLQLGSSALQKHLHRTTNIAEILTKDDKLLQKYEQMLTGLAEEDVTTFLAVPNDPVATALLTGAELVIQLYIQQVWSSLTTILTKAYDTASEKTEATKEFRLRLDDAALNGLRGLNHTLVTQALNFEPILSQARPINKDTSKNSIFSNKYFVDRSWRSRLQALFATDDLDTKRRSWETYGYRQLFRSLQHRIRTRMGDALATRFLGITTNQAAHTLLIVPRFEVDKFIVELKAANAHGPARQQFLKSESRLRRITWLMPQFSNAPLPAQQLSRHHLTAPSRCGPTTETSPLSIYKELRHGPQFSSDIARRQAELLRAQVMEAKMMTFSQSESPSNLLKDPQSIQHDTALVYATRFHSRKHF